MRVELTISEERVQHMKMRNTELRNELESIRKENARILGTDVEGLSLRELDELRGQMVQSVTKTNEAKDDLIRKEMKEKETRMLSETDSVYMEVLRQMRTKEKELLGSVAALQEANDELRAKCAAADEELRTIDAELAQEPSLQERVARLTQQLSKFATRKTELEKEIAANRSQTATDEAESAYLSGRLTSLQTEFAQMWNELTRRHPVRIPMTRRALRAGNEETPLIHDINPSKLSDDALVELGFVCRSLLEGKSEERTARD